MRLLNLPNTQTPNNEMIRSVSAHVVMSAYLLYILRKGGTLGQQRRTEVKHTHNYVLIATTTILYYNTPMLSPVLSVTGYIYHQLCLPSDLLC